MQAVFTTRIHLDALRFQNFLAERGIDAEIRTLGPDNSQLAVAETPREFAVWVADERMASAGALVDEFQRTLDQTAEDEDISNSPPDDDILTDASLVRARVPFLTGLFCIACIVASVGLWNERHPRSTEALARWGWRDELDIADGAYWAVWTSTLPHEPVDHLVMNLLGVALLGFGIERVYGRSLWVGLFLSAALVSASAALAARGILGFGASGVLYAFCGFVLVASVRKRLLPMWILIPLSIWLLYCAIFDVADVLQYRMHGERIDSAACYAHLSGLLLGMLFAIAFAISWKPRLTRTALGMILLAGLIPLGGSPWLADWLLTRAERASRNESPAAAIEWYSRAIAGDPQAPDAYVGRAWMLLIEGRYDEALADCDKAVSIDARARSANGIRAQILMIQSKLDAALEAANQELNAGRLSALGFTVRGNMHFVRADFDAAITDVSTAIDLEPRAANHWAGRAIARRELCQFEAALADADHSLWLDPQNETAHLARGNICAELMRQDRAQTDLDSAYNLLKGRLQRTPRNVWLHCNVVECQVLLFGLDANAARLADALEHADQAVKFAPDYWDSWALRGIVEYHRREYSRAVGDLSRAIELNSHDYWSASSRGLALHELNRTEEAIHDLDRALAVNPRFAFGYRSRAIVRSAQGQHREAIDDLTRAIELNGRFAEAYRLRGKARLARGETEAGHADLKHATDLDPRLGRLGAASPGSGGDDASPQD